MNHSSDSPLNVTVHHFSKEASGPSQSLLLEQGRNLVYRGLDKKLWHSLNGLTALPESKCYPQFLYSSTPPFIAGTRSTELKEWGSPLDASEIFSLQDLADFTCTDFGPAPKRELTPVSTDREGTHPTKKRKLDHRPLNHVVPHPHILVPLLPRVSSRQIKIPSYRKSNPIMISPYKLPLNDLDEHDRCSWIIPIRGKLLWPESTSGVLLDPVQDLPASPTITQTNEIAWTTAAIIKFWEFLIGLRDAGNLGPLGLSFHTVPSPFVEKSIRVSMTIPTDAADTSVSGGSASSSSVSISSVDHFKIYHDWPRSLQLRHIFHAWSFEAGEHKPINVIPDSGLEELRSVVAYFIQAKTSHGCGTPRGTVFFSTIRLSKVTRDIYCSSSSIPFTHAQSFKYQLNNDPIFLPSSPLNWVGFKMSAPSTNSAEATQPLDEAQIKQRGQEAKDGTLHQNAIGSKVKRKHFFSPLDPAWAEAVHKDAETVQYTPEEEWRVKRKIDNGVLPLVIVSYCFNQFDRTNIGNAHVIQAFNENYGITTNQKWTIALSIFYVGYCLLEMPANSKALNSDALLHGKADFTLVLQRHIGANRFFFLSLTFWGLCSLSFTYAKGYAALLVLRVLMGIGEAGYYAGMIYYLSFWYKRSELAVRIRLSLLFCRCSLSCSHTLVYGLLAFGLVRARTSLLTGWQFLFLIEAIPTIIMGIVILFFLPSFPFSAPFLSPRERAIAQARLNGDHKPQSHGGMTGWQGFKAIIAEPNAWLFMTIYASFNVGVATVSYFLPTLIKGLGFSSINAQGLTVAPYVVGWFMVYLQSWHSDYTKDRGYHIMFSATLSLIGYIILATSAEKSVGAAYFALFLVVGGNYSLFPLVMSWAANTFSPTSKRGVGTAFIVSISNCVSIASPQVYFDPEDSFRKGHAIAAGCLALCIITTFLTRTRLNMMNKRNQRILQERSSRASREEEEKGSTEARQEGEGGEVWDDDPRYVFLT
ncbi:hypothetical protein D9756_009799 [Leucocoprinus leucothites]|uniref:Major facilitator superfamily (MFS) profile domain-containing protein n=1 Tax=Leucocoprinus leucothites TaxID=201217 RepID=A0A8H5CXE9_9AGAR|nr:hypothetical protein D9756_009799 [Leucoagaricus leucothites]